MVIREADRAPEDPHRNVQLYIECTACVETFGADLHTGVIIRALRCVRPALPVTGQTRGEFE